METRTLRDSICPSVPGILVLVLVLVQGIAGHHSEKRDGSALRQGIGCDCGGVSVGLSLRRYTTWMRRGGVVWWCRWRWHGVMANTPINVPRSKEAGIGGFARIRDSRVSVCRNVRIVLMSCSSCPSFRVRRGYRPGSGQPRSGTYLYEKIALYGHPHGYLYCRYYVHMQDLLSTLNMAGRTPA